MDKFFGAITGGGGLTVEIRLTPPAEVPMAPGPDGGPPKPLIIPIDHEPSVRI